MSSGIYARMKKERDPQFQRRSERIKNPRTLLEKRKRIEELERLADDELLVSTERHELMRLRKQLKGFKFVIHSVPRDQLNKLSDEDRRRVLSTTKEQYMVPKRNGYPDPRKMFFGVRPGRLTPKEEKIVETFRAMQRIRKAIEEFKPKEKSDG